MHIHDKNCKNPVCWMNKQILDSIGPVGRNDFYFHIGPDGMLTYLAIIPQKQAPKVKLRKFTWTPFSYN